MAALVGKGGCFIFYHVVHKQCELFPLAGAAWAASWTGIFFGARVSIWICSARGVWMQRPRRGFGGCGAGFWV